MAASLGVIDQLAQAQSFAPEQLVQAYMESRGYLIGDAANTRKIHAVAAWVLLSLHNQRNQTADAGQTESLLIHYANALNVLKAKLQTQDITAIIESSRQVQLLAEDVSKRELVIARVTTRMALIRLVPEPKWDTSSTVGTAPSVDDILSPAGMASRKRGIAGSTTGMNEELWDKAAAAMRTDGSLFLDWNSFKLEQWKVGGIYGRKDMFGPEAKKVQEVLDTGASDDEW